jgi:hypothetical protein
MYGFMYLIILRTFRTIKLTNSINYIISLYFMLGTINTLPTAPTTTANTQTTSQPSYIIGPLIFNCNFDQSSILTNQCGGISTLSVPGGSIALFGTFQNELIQNSNPPIYITDVKSISIKTLK